MTLIHTAFAIKTIGVDIVQKIKANPLLGKYNLKFCARAGAQTKFAINLLN